LANMKHPLTGSDYIAEQTLDAAIAEAVADLESDLDTAAATAVDEVLDATIDTKVAAAIVSESLVVGTAAASEPATPVTGQIWVDTTSGEVVKLYTGTAWVTVTTTPID